MPSSKPGRKTIIRFNRASDADRQDVCELQPEQLPPKGQLFVVATGTNGRSETKEACRLAIRLIHEVYYSDSSRDIPTSLRRALRDANSVIHEMFNANGGRRKLGINCSCLVVTKASIHLAQVGQSSVYRVASRKIERLLDTPERGDRHRTGGNGSRRASGRRENDAALGVATSPCVKMRPAVTLATGDRFLLCSDALKRVDLEMIRQIVSSGSPQESSNWLTDFAHNSGIEQLDVRIIENVAVGTKRKGGKSVLRILRSVAGWLVVVSLAGLAVALSDRWLTRRTPIVAELADDYPLPGFHPALAQADSLLRLGATDAALDAYQRVLTEDPTHTHALDQIDEIAARFKKTGNSYFDSGDYVQASEYYTKALQLRADDQEVLRLLMQCVSKLQRPATEHKELTPDRRPMVSEAVSEDRSMQEEVRQATRSHLWLFTGLTDADFRLARNAVEFLPTGAPKKAFYHKDLSDFNARLNLRRVDNELSGRWGVILAYRSLSHSPYETFYLLSAIKKNELLLQRCTALKKELIARIPLEAAEANHELTLEVTSTANHLIVSSNGKRVYVLNEDENIQGKIGLYADPHVHVQFTEMTISSTPRIKNIVNPYARN